MDKVVNLLNLAGWTFLLVDIQIQLIFDLNNFLVSDISFELQLLRAIQLFQIFDIVLVVLGKSKGSIVGSFFQILGRNVVCLFFMQLESHQLKFAAVVLLWSIADTNRYLYYLFKNNPITTFLRYNSFLVLYPAGVLAEMFVINDFIERHTELTELWIIIIRAIQAMIILGMIFLYNYMLKGRKKHMNHNHTHNEEIQSSSNKKSNEIKDNASKQASKDE